jgi:hypothetical protein
MAATSSSQLRSQLLQPNEEVDENFQVDVDLVAIDGHYSRVSVGESFTYRRPTQLRSTNPATAEGYSRISNVEAWINQELFGDVVEASLQHQDERELYLTTLRKDVDEYIEMVPAISHSIDEEQDHVLQPQGTDDFVLSPVDSEYQGVYYDEPQLWCFT